MRKQDLDLSSPTARRGGGGVRGGSVSQENFCPPKENQLLIRAYIDVHLPCPHVRLRWAKNHEPLSHARIYGGGGGGPRGPGPPEISKVFINFYLLANVIISIKIWNALN